MDDSILHPAIDNSSPRAAWVPMKEPENPSSSQATLTTDADPDAPAAETKPDGAASPRPWLPEHPRISRCRILSIANQKGGVGKTTTAVNLGTALAMTGMRVLLIDMDPQANATSALGQKAEKGQPTIYDVLIGSHSIQEAKLSTELDGLKLVASSPQFAGAEIELVTLEKREHLLRGQLEPEKERFDYVFIDCPPSLGLLTLNALSASDGVIVPIQTEYLALEGLTHLLETLQAIRASLNPKLRVEGILLTMYDGRLSLSQQVAQEARAYFGSRVYQTMIPRNVRLGEAPSFGKPILLYDRTCSGAMSYVNLAKEILENESESSRSRPEGAYSRDSG